MTKLQKETTRKKAERKTKFIGSEQFWCYIMIALPLIGFLVFNIYPILWTFRWSFFSYNGIPSQTKFIGLENFKTMFTTDFTYWRSWGNTLLIAAIRIPVEMTLAMGLALILNKKMKGSGFFQAMYYLPHIISMAIIGLILSNMFSYNGIINSILVKIGIIKENIDWFANRSTAIVMVVLGISWAHFGVNVMYCLAALANVPDELYECANLDGASKIRTFFSVTLPMIAPIFSTILLLSVNAALSTNEYIIILTNGGPHGQTSTVMSYMYTKFVPGFAETTAPQIGYGCAMSLMTTILFTTVAFAYSRFNKRMKDLY